MSFFRNTGKKVRAQHEPWSDVLLPRSPPRFREIDGTDISSFAITVGSGRELCDPSIRRRIGVIERLV